jgi:hypothetical protein
MAHFAKVEDGIVTNVVVVDDEHEANGQEFLNGLGLEGVWIQTSYNTFSGQHSSGGTPLRKNYAGIGFSYDEVRDAFIPPKPYPSWVLNEETCNWEPPVPRPEGDVFLVWDEDTQTWIPHEVKEP